MTTLSSPPQSNIELMRRAFSALGREDVDACVKLMPSDFRINIAGMPYQKRGTDAWRKHAEILFLAFPDTFTCRLRISSPATTKSLAQIGGTGLSMGKLASMWLAGYRVWFALFLGIAIGVLSMVLLHFIL